jgi:hypothetical protein
MAQRAEYFVWHLMHRRCRPDHPHFKHYGARGITVCKRWSGPEGFANFFADMGPRPPGPKWYWTLERVNNDLGYCPSNCKWATRREQFLNKRSHGWNRLTSNQVHAIRADPRRPYRLIAVDYGVTRHMIGMIIRGDVWNGHSS